MESGKLPISACFIAKWEADRIGSAIDAVRGFCRDVLVVIDPVTDTDGTEAMAKAHGARVLHCAWHGYGPVKRFAEDNAEFDWVLSLDADEIVSEKLAREIRKLFAPQPTLSFYRLRVTEVYPHHTKPRLWAEVTNVVRLFDRRHGMTSLSAVHDRVETPDRAAIGQLNAPVYHKSIRSLKHLRRKYDAYTTLQARTLKKKPLWLLLIRLVTEFPMAFFQYYIGQRNFTGGLFGLGVALVKAEARWKRIMKLLKAQLS